VFLILEFFFFFFGKYLGDLLGSTYNIVVVNINAILSLTLERSSLAYIGLNSDES
jgi:hypothetical protein